LASQVVGTAQAFPDEETITQWGQALSQAIVALLKGEVNAGEAVQMVNVALAEE
jgi:hypothetical protein